MVYEKIDPLLDKWASMNNLRILRKDQGVDVRSVDIVDTKGQRFQIWIDVPDMNGLIGIHVWDYKRRGRRRDFIASSNDLTEYLNSAVKIAKSWGGTQAAQFRDVRAKIWLIHELGDNKTNPASLISAVCDLTL